MLKSMQDIVDAAQSLPTQTLVVAMADDPHVLEAVERAREAGIVASYLIGDEPAIRQTLDALGYAAENHRIEHEADAEKACKMAVKRVSQADDHFLMKGLVDTSVILKAALSKQDGLRGPNRLSHVSVMEIPTYHKLLIMSDGAMNIAPDVDIKQEIIENSLSVTRSLGIDLPNIGVIAAVEKVNPKMPATLDAQNLILRNQSGMLTGCRIGGPFALDNAINREAAEHKGITDPMAGDVDMVLMPQIESGNVFYKSMMFLAHAKSASVIVGATRPIVLTSRADSTESKLYSIALGALVAARASKSTIKS
ncbi:MAG: bifunctional enoyl-CoA hydratase/phosphate acetyltransferase [Acholeplasmatales bacterium]|nr:MAG: bifunctional enoyl-CoA hydratase/phosphate acetyltransferase [Acholeplasmatales bacterium]